MKTTKDLASGFLEDAADLLEKDGWIQGDYHGHSDHELSAHQDPTGHCAIGALSSAMNIAGLGRYHQDRYPVFHAAMNAMHRMTVEPVAWWNDRPDRTKQEVLDILRKAAKEVVSE